MQTEQHDRQDLSGADSSSQAAVRTVCYPSAQFPGPPVVRIDAPESWRPIAPEGYLQFGAKVDIAIAGPDGSAPVRPNLIVSISRTTPTDKPAELLAEVATAGVGEQQIKRQSLIESSQDSATDGGRHLCHVATIEDQDGEHRVTRLRCSVYVHGDLMAHVVSIIGSTGADDQAGLDALTAMFDTLRIDQNPGYHQRDRGDERGASQ